MEMISESNMAYVSDHDNEIPLPGLPTEHVIQIQGPEEIQVSTGFTSSSENSSSSGSISSMNEKPASAKQTAPPRVRLTWNNLEVKVPPKGGLFAKSKGHGKQILFGVSGYAEPGTLLAIMGSSGAGKSTLLNILTWRNRQNLHLKGDILTNGIALGPDITGISAYVQQDDLFMGELTVKEHLIFSARLRMDAELSDKDRSKRVHEVMMQMGLKKCETTQIGTPGKTKTISGGEMKRLTFASELLTRPAILFCDEPTSGLDSYLAKVIVDCLRSVARQGCTVLCTIHQPSSETFELFDRLLLLALGKVVYHGDAKEAINHYSEVGFPCPPNYNPADHYIMAISMIPGQEDSSREQIANFTEAYKNSTFFSKVKKVINALDDNVEERKALSAEIKAKKKKPRYRVGFMEQFRACTVRAFKVTYRNPVLTRVKVGQTMFASIIAGLVYLRPNFYKPYLSSDVMTVVGSLFMVITNNSFTSAIGVMNSFPSEIPIFRREHFNGMYSTAVFFFSKNLADIPIYCFLPLIYAIIAYFMFGLYPTAAKFFIFYAIVVLLCNTCVSFGYMVACLSPNIGVALSVGPALLMPLLLLGGFFIPASQIPVYLIWLKYLSWFFYTNELLNINQWEFVDNLCPETDVMSTFAPNATAAPVCGTSCQFPDGTAALANLGFRVENFGRDIGLMFALLVGYRAVALGFLYYRVRESTR